MAVKKADNLLLQPLPNARTFGLQNQSFRGVLAANKAEETVLQTVEGILQLEMQHRAWLDFPAPYRLSLRNLQTQPQRQPAFARFAGARKQGKPSREQTGDNPLCGWNRRGKQVIGGNNLR